MSEFWTAIGGEIINSLKSGLNKMAKKKDNPELEEVIPETGDEDMIDQACQEKADSYEGENAAENNQQPDDVKQDAEEDQQPNGIEQADNAQKTDENKHAMADEKPGTGKHAKKAQKPAEIKQPTIDDLIANIQGQSAPKAKVDLPDHLVPKKKVWTPDQGVTKKEATMIGEAPELKPVMTVKTQTKVPPGLVSGPAQHAAGTDPQPFIFKLNKIKIDHFDLLKVYASPVQKAQALVGVEALHPKYLYLWFDCFSGKAGNTTTKRIRAYLIKGYNEFVSMEMKPNKMIDLPGDIQHVIMTCTSAPQIMDFEFLEPYMPIKPIKEEK